MPNIRINVIVPKKAIFDGNKWLAEVKNVMHSKTEPDLRGFFKGTTEGWKNQPDFLAHHFQQGDTVGVEVYTRDSVYGLVNAGSPAHLIRPRSRGGLLRFQAGYQSATRPGSLRSGPYRRFGAGIAAVQVRHPGFKARRFDEQIADEYRSVFQADIEKTFKAGLP